MLWKREGEGLNGLVVEIEHGVAEILLSLLQDLGGGGAGVGRRGVVEWGHFGNRSIGFGEWRVLLLGLLREGETGTEYIS